MISQGVFTFAAVESPSIKLLTRRRRVISPFVINLR